MVKDQYPDAVKEATSSVLPVWLEAFKTLLNVNPLQDVENTTNWDGLAIRIQVFKVRYICCCFRCLFLTCRLVLLIQTLDTIQTSFPRSLPAHLQNLLNAALLHLSTLYPTFHRYYLQQAAAVPRSSEDETIELIHLICPMLDFVANVARSGRAKEWFEGDHLSSLITLVFTWTQMTHDDASVSSVAIT